MEAADRAGAERAHDDVLVKMRTHNVQIVSVHQLERARAGELVGRVPGQRERSGRHGDVSASFAVVVLDLTYHLCGRRAAMVRARRTRRAF